MESVQPAKSIQPMKPVQPTTPDVSVIVPVYNKASKLPECLESLLMQSLDNIEIVCVDDCSTDGSDAVLREFATIDDRVKVVTHECNSGVGASRNTGLDAARGRYIAFVDADDALEQTLLQHAVAKCDSVNAHVGLYGMTRVCPSTGTREVDAMSLYLPFLPANRPDPFTCDIAKDKAFLFTGASACIKLFNHDFLNGLDLRFTGHAFAEDLLFTYTALANALRVTAVDDYGYLYDQETISGGELSIEKAPQLIDVLDILRERLVTRGLMERYHDGFINLAIGHLENIIQTATSNAELEQVFKTIVGWHDKTGQEIFGRDDVLFASDQYARDYELISDGDFGKFADYRHEFNIAAAMRAEGRVPAVSIIVPVYNKAKVLADSIKSLLSQTLRGIEVVCVDDCSTDDSLAILEELAALDGRVKVVRHTANRGVGGARNTGIENASGEYVVFMDADDELSSDALEKIYIKAVNTDADICLYGITYNYPSINYRRVEPMSLRKPFAPTTDDGVFTCDMAGSNAFQISGASVCTKMFKRSFLNAHNLRLTDHKFAEDLLFSFTALSLANRVTLVDEYPYLYNIDMSEGGIVKPEIIHVLLDVFSILNNRLIEAGLYDRYRDAFLSAAMPHIDNILLNVADEAGLRLAYDAIIGWKHAGGSDLFEIENAQFSDEQYETIYRLIKDESYDDFLAFNFERAQTRIVLECQRADIAEGKVAKLENELASARAEANAAKKEIEAVRNSHSYKLGNAFMKLPSKAKQAIKKS